MPDISENKNLIVRPGVELPPAVTPIILALDPVFGTFQVRAEVSSAFRDPRHQLRVLRDICLKMGLDANWTESDVDTVLADGHHIWQPEWSYVNHRGVFVRPPKPMKMLYRFISPTTGENLFGQVIDLSSHQKGLAFDIVPAFNSQSLTLIKQVVDYAMSRSIIKVAGVLLEDKNGAIHITCLPVQV